MTDETHLDYEEEQALLAQKQYEEHLKRLAEEGKVDTGRVEERATVRW